VRPHFLSTHAEMFACVLLRRTHLLPLFVFPALLMGQVPVAGASCSYFPNVSSSELSPGVLSQRPAKPPAPERVALLYTGADVASRA
jgi:hypothetical protein